METTLENTVLDSSRKPVSRAHKLELKTTRLKYWNSLRRYHY
ncbi:hypothetical protein [Psychroflexus aurantiacus]|nr:hypothetical protein [Psychroflexus aurantiacus]